MSLGGFFIMVIAAWAFVSFGVASHAQSNNKTGLWGLAVFFTGIFGLVGYAISLASD